MYKLRCLTPPLPHDENPLETLQTSWPNDPDDEEGWEPRREGRDVSLATALELCPRGAPLREERTERDNLQTLLDMSFHCVKLL